MYHVCDSLRIGRGAGATAVDAIVDVGQFVCYAVSLKTSQLSEWRSVSERETHDVASCCRPTVCADNHAAVELDGHD